MKEKVVFKINALQSALDLVKALTLEQYIVQIETVYGEYPYEHRILYHKVTVLEEDLDCSKPEVDW